MVGVMVGDMVGVMVGDGVCEGVVVTNGVLVAVGGAAGVGVMISSEV